MRIVSVYFISGIAVVPGFNGISSPYWKTGFNDIYVDLDSNPDQIIRAGMESIGYLTNDILQCMMQAELKIPKLLTASGGAGRPTLLQFISNLSDIEIGYSAIKDRTAIGVYKILCGDYSNVDDEVKFQKKFLPKTLPYKKEKLNKLNQKHK